MAESVELVAQHRDGNGTKEARKLRRSGLVPAVVYGHKEKTESLAIAADVLYRAIRHGVRIVDLKQDGGVQKALIREVQWDPLGHDVLHVDFARVAADERITLDVRVELRGTAPGIAAGGVVVQPIHSLSVECLVVAVPESIRVNIGELQLDQVIHVKDLVLPEGLVVKNDPEAIVVQVVHKAVEVAAPAAVPGAAPEQAEPEVITARKAEEEPAEEKK